MERFWGSSEEGWRAGTEVVGEEAGPAGAQPRPGMWTLVRKKGSF